jgi:hypothetical protein
MEHIILSHKILKEIEHTTLIAVLIESPLSSDTIEGIVRNKKFARACLRDSLERGEAPYASHLLYAQEGLLNDDIPEERALGIHAGLIWGAFAKKTIVYTDLGISLGMEKGIERAKKEQREIEYRTLNLIPVVMNEEIILEEQRQNIIKLLTDKNVKTYKP